MNESSRTHMDELALAALVQQMIDGWNKGDGQAYAAPFTEDADYVIVDGSQVKGRQTIAFGHQYIFDSVYKGSTMEAHVKDMRFLSPDIALMHAEGVLHLSDRTGAASQQSSTMTIIAIRQNGLWSFTAFHNTPKEARKNRA